VAGVSYTLYRVPSLYFCEIKLALTSSRSHIPGYSLSYSPLQCYEARWAVGELMARRIVGLFVDND